MISRAGNSTDPSSNMAPSLLFTGGSVYVLRVIALALDLMSSWMPLVQQKIIYVFDPKAMHAIAVKDQYIFDEARWFLQ